MCNYLRYYKYETRGIEENDWFIHYWRDVVLLLVVLFEREKFIFHGKKFGLTKIIDVPNSLFFILINLIRNDKNKNSLSLNKSVFSITIFFWTYNTFNLKY